MKKILTAACALALAATSFATIQPTRVGPVSQYGALQAGKNSADEGRIYGSVGGIADGKEVQVRGMSLTWSMYWPNGSSFYGPTFIDTLVGGWNVELIRSAMGVVPPWGHGGYMTRPAYFESQMDSVVQAAIRNDVYVLIDWHSEGGYFNCVHPGQKPAQSWMKFNDNETCFSAADAAKFFDRMAERYGKYPHVIFEIYNEPVAETWADLKAYADTVVAAIRKHSDNLIVVGNPQWSSQAGDAVANPIDDKNIAYTYHFYADIHTTKSHIESSNKAMAAGLSVFVTEWGGIDKIFSNATHKAQLEEFLAWTSEKKLSMAKWDVEKPYLENNDVDNYIKANILPAKTTYTKNLEWEKSISDKLPNLVVYSEVKEIAGSWNLFGDETEADPNGNYGTSTYEDNSADGVAKFDNIKLDAASPFEYSPYVKADYKFTGDISKCKMIQYSYKGSNHEFTLYYDWMESIEKFGEGAWDFPFVEMPLAMDWETVNVDLGWMMNNNWQKGIPNVAVPELASALRFTVIDVAYDPSLWIKDVKCVESVEGYEPVKIEIPTAISTPKLASNFKVSVQNRMIVAAGVQNGSKYVFTNMLGQKIASGRVMGNNLALEVSKAGNYILRVGSNASVVVVK